MKITPRAEEYKPVIEILESDDYKDATAMAKAVVKVVADMLDMRDWYAIGHKFSEDSTHVIGWGPFASDTDALAVAEKSAIGGVWSVKKLHSPGYLTGRLEGREGGGFGFCRTPGCGHPADHHFFQASGRGTCAFDSCAKYKK